MKQYPKYKDSGINWLKQLPNDWGIKRLKYSSKVQFSNVDKKSFNDEIDVKLCNYTDVYNNEYITNDFSFMNATATSFEIEKFQLNKNDVLITKDSETPDDIAVPSFVKKDIPNTLCAYHLAQIRPKHQEILGEYLFRLFQVKDFNTKFITSANGVTRFGLSNYSIANINVTIPPIEQQKVIVNYLDKKTEQIDTLIEKKQKQIELLKEYRTAIINQAVTKGLNPNAKMKDSGIEWLCPIPEHWNVKRLKFIIKINPTKSEISNNINFDEMVTFLPMENVSINGIINNSNKKTIRELINGFTYFSKNDIIVAKITPCFENGKGAYLDNLDSMIGFGSTEFHVLRALPNVTDSKYIYYITKSDIFMKSGEAFMYGAAGQKRVPSDFIENFIIAIPNIDEQLEIVKYIDSKINKTDNQLSQNEKQIKQLREYRTTLISDAVTGKIDIRDEVN